MLDVTKQLMENAEPKQNSVAEPAKLGCLDSPYDHII